jgi:lipid A 3-O-deacylase
LPSFRRSTFGAVLVLAVLVMGGVVAGIVPAAAQGNLLDELRVGVLRHDAGVFGTHEEGGVDFNGELRFVSPDFLKVILAPRPHLGITVNSDGNTDQAYAGLTWSFILFRGLASAEDNLFLDVSFGGAVHDGHIRTNDVDRKELGSRFEFRESLEIGWRFTAAQSLSIMLDHISNANLGVKNEGLDNLGLRYGIKF